jgi:hypothetical protein
MSTTLELKSLLQAVFHHVVLPSKLPSKNDADNDGLAYDLGSRLQRALAKFSNDQDQDAWNVLVRSMKATTVLNQGQLISQELLEVFQSVVSDKNNIWLTLFVTQQNSALLVHRNDMSVSKSPFPMLKTYPLTPAIVKKQSFSKHSRPLHRLKLFSQQTMASRGNFLIVQSKSRSTFSRTSPS